MLELSWQIVEEGIDHWSPGDRGGWSVGLGNGSRKGMGKLGDAGYVHYLDWADVPGVYSIHISNLIKLCILYMQFIICQFYQRYTKKKECGKKSKYRLDMRENFLITRTLSSQM